MRGVTAPWAGATCSARGQPETRGRALSRAREVRAPGGAGGARIRGCPDRRERSGIRGVRCALAKALRRRAISRGEAAAGTACRGRQGHWRGAELRARRRGRAGIARGGCGLGGGCRDVAVWPCKPREVVGRGASGDLAWLAERARLEGLPGESREPEPGERDVAGRAKARSRGPTPLLGSALESALARRRELVEGLRAAGPTLRGLRVDALEQELAGVEVLGVHQP